jgi:hypothetical protein
MSPPLVDVRRSRVEAAKGLADHFNRFEWNYLCSYQWFLNSIDQAFDTGEFLAVQTRAEEALIAGKLRRQTSTVSDNGCCRETVGWFS